jgi:hypothetical protein
LDRETEEIWETAERDTSRELSASAPDKEGARIEVVVVVIVVAFCSTLSVFLVPAKRLAAPPVDIDRAITTATAAPSPSAYLQVTVIADEFPTAALVAGSTDLSLVPVSFPELGRVSASREPERSVVLVMAEVGTVTGEGEERDDVDPFLFFFFVFLPPPFPLPGAVGTKSSGSTDHSGAECTAGLGSLLEILPEGPCSGEEAQVGEGGLEPPEAEAEAETETEAEPSVIESCEGDVARLA